MEETHSQYSYPYSLLKYFANEALIGIASHVVDRWKYTTVENIKSKAMPGDLIEFHRGYYSHYSLYMGNGNVMDVYCADDKNRVTALIREMRLEKVCGDSRVRVSNHDDIALKHLKVQPKHRLQIIRDAKSFEGKIVPYEFDFRNCEYYSTLWRYGIGFSTQVANPVLTPIGSIVSGIISSDKTAAVMNEARNVFQRNIYKKYMNFNN